MSSSPTLQSGTTDCSNSTMTRVAARLYAPYFNDLLDDDVDAFLGAAAGPTGLTGIESLPIHEPEHLDARRASVGRPPLSVALADVQRRHGTREPEPGHAQDEDAMPELAGAA